MRFATVAIAVFGAAATASASLVARQSPYPACADPCVAKADYGTCQQTDIKCLCTNQGFVTSTTTCIESSCQGDDLTKAKTVAQGLCASVGVTLTPSGTSGSSSASATATKPTSGGSSATGSAAPASTSKSAATSNGVQAALGVAAAAVAALAL